MEDPLDNPPGGCVVDGIEEEDEDEDAPWQIPPPEHVELVGQPRDSISTLFAY